jgi:tripartite-type tricarboxylate transporter receptor subunit TctC
MEPSPTRTARRLWLTGVVVCLAAAAAPAAAQDYPTRPVRFIVPTPPGSGPDVDLRNIAARLGPLLGQSVVVENRPGAGTRIAAEAVSKATPDGYTFLLGTPSLVTMAALYAKLPFDPRRDLVPVSLLSTTAYTLTVNAAVPARTVSEFMALAKSAPGATGIATLGVGTIPHLTGTWFGSETGADFKFVHYNTSPPIPDLVAGQTAAMFEAMLPMMPHVQSGRLRMLAISGKTRHPLLPNVPTFAEAGMPAFDPMVWVGILAPAGTPAPIVARMSAALAQVARTPEVVAFRRDAGSESIGSTPEAFGAFLDAERAKWGAVIRSTGLKLD